MAGDSRTQNNNTCHLIRPRIGVVLRFARISTGLRSMRLKIARLLKEVSTQLRWSVNHEIEEINEIFRSGDEVGSLRQDGANAWITAVVAIRAFTALQPGDLPLWKTWEQHRLVWQPGEICLVQFD